MSIPNEIPNVERPAFFDGQRLTAADLAAVQDYQRELRWLHNRSLHTWGIAFGLEVLAKRGDRAVTVQIGYALDCLGRDLLVNAPVSLPIPPVSGSATGPALYYLTLSYLEDGDLPPELRQGVCDTNGAVRLPERARLRWQQQEDSNPESRYRHGYDVILASIQVQNCKLAAEPSPKLRREARPASQPYVAAGSSSGLAWEPVTSAGAVVGLKTSVDTSSAGFGATPQYMAHINGERAITGSQDLLDGLVSIGEATPVSFTLTIIMPPEVPLGGGAVLNSSKFMNNGLPSVVEEMHWSITWLGIEG